MSAPALETTLSNLTACLAKPWADALTRLLGTASTVTIAPAAAPVADGSPLCLSISFDGLLSGDAVLMILDGDLSILADKSCDTPRDGSSPGPEKADATVRQTFQQAILAAMSAFQAKHGPLRARIEVGTAPSWKARHSWMIEGASADRPGVRAYLLCHDNLRISSHVDADRSAAIDAAGAAENLGLVMDAALEVTLRFGQQSITLSRLATLGPGSVVELDRRIEEPIDLVLGGRVLARGEVMIVDGNYGLRVTELTDRRAL